MLVYANHFVLEPKSGLPKVLACIAKWLGKRSGEFVDPQAFNDAAVLRLRDGSAVRVGRAQNLGERKAQLISVSLTHADEIVSGRQWTVEVGLRTSADNELVECSILTQTSEISARVVAPIQATRPRLVADLLASCSPKSGTPGLAVKSLDPENAEMFSAALDHASRVSPWVVVSPARDGKYLIDPERLRTNLVGIADVFAIPPSADTFEIQRLVGPLRTTWLGGVRVIFAAQSRGESNGVGTVLFHPEAISQTLDDGGAPWADVLAAVTHRTNLPISWRHISPSVVSNARLQNDLALAIEKAKGSDGEKEYVTLLAAADAELKKNDDLVAALRQEVSERTDAISKLEAERDGLKFSLSGAKSTGSEVTTPIGLAPLRATILSSIASAPSPEDALSILAALFSDRLTVLPTAYEAARKSIGFRHRAKAMDLLTKLTTTYWDALAVGMSDSEARKVFGNAYSAKEAESLSGNGIERRTFSYKGRPVEMMRHLKIGVKDSAAETLRVHFEWFDDEKRIVIGHCGPHIDFK